MAYNFAPKKPVKSFLDLEVYQNALAAAVFVAKYIVVPPSPAEAGYGGRSPLPAKEGADIALPSGGKEQGESPSQNASTFAEASVDKLANQSAEPKVQGDMLQEQATSATASANATAVEGGTARELIYHQMLPCALGLPHLIAEAHSVRFGSQKDCLILLERAMLHCNKMVVYLEETRDICDTGVAWEKFNELIKRYLFIRQKTLNLQRSWKKYMEAK